MENHDDRDRADSARFEMQCPGESKHMANASSSVELRQSDLKMRAFELAVKKEL